MEVANKRTASLPVYVEAPAPSERVDGIAWAECPSDEVFAQALRDNSNHELDWLWVYVQVKTDQQRRYCLERALAINPSSAMALRELEALSVRLQAERGDRS